MNAIQFAGESFEVLAVNGRKAMTAQAIGKHLKYAEPRKYINKLFNRYRDEFEAGVDHDFIKIHDDDLKSVRPQNGDAGRIREVLVFYETGAILLTMFTEQPEGKRYRKIFKHILAGVAADPDKARRPYMTGARQRALIATYDHFIKSGRTAEDQVRAAAQAEHLALLKAHVALQKQLLDVYTAKQ